MPRMPEKVQIICRCGAVYERTEQKMVFKHCGVFECSVCGELVETWRGRRLPQFTLIKKGRGD